MLSIVGYVKLSKHLFLFLCVFWKGIFYNLTIIIDFLFKRYENLLLKSKVMKISNKQH